MGIKFRKATRPVSNSEIESFEASFGIALPDAYKRFLSQYNGTEPETNAFRIDETNESGVNGFIPFAQIGKERELMQEEILDRAIPVAWAEGGNYILLELGQDVAVYFWDHEDPAHPTRLASDFAGFLDLLQPFDVSSIELKPGQVKSVWIDPRLL